MEDLAGKLNELLNSPEGMARIQNLANMLGQSSEKEKPAETPKAADNGGLGSLASLLSGIGGSGSESGASGLADASTLQMVTKLAPMLSTVRQEDDSTRLLKALRPLLTSERQKKLDEAVKILQLMKMFPLLKQSGLLSQLL